MLTYVLAYLPFRGGRTASVSDGHHGSWGLYTSCTLVVSARMSPVLTLSLPCLQRCHWENDRPVKLEVPNLKSLRLFFAPFARTREQIYIRMDSTESEICYKTVKCIICYKTVKCTICYKTVKCTICRRSVCVHFSARKFYGLGQLRD